MCKLHTSPVAEPGQAPAELRGQGRARSAAVTLTQLAGSPPSVAAGHSSIKTSERHYVAASGDLGRKIQAAFGKAKAVVA